MSDAFRTSGSAASSSKPAWPRLRSASRYRLYQADWLLRFYEFSTVELTSAMPRGQLDLWVDPKTAWALAPCGPVHRQTLQQRGGDWFGNRDEECGMGLNAE
jgi:predicted DNA-binding helix-hairpin-helix protein